MNGNYDETSSSDQLNRRKKVTLLNRLRSNKTTPRIDSFSSNDTKKFINKDNFDLDENNYFDEDEPPEINSHVPHRSSSSFSSLPSSSTPSKLSQKSNYNEKPKDEQPSLKSQYKRLSTSVSGSLSSISAVRNNEFNSLCPDRCLTVFVVTWNMAGIEKLPENLRDIFLDQEFERPPSVFAIGTQESTSQRTKLFVAIQQILGSEYLLYAESNLGVLYLGIFIQRHLLWHCSPYEKDQISVRAVKQLKTKGAVAVCFYVFGTSFLFINVHLIAGDTKSLERSKNYIEILNSLNLPKKFTIRSNSMTSKKVNERFDCVFWMGDFNSRSQSQTGNLKKNMSGEENRFNRFLHHDEINHYNPKKKISINEDMCEGDITFEPTYKFEIGTQTYIRHAFTDRIFYCSKHKNAIRCCKYSSAKCIVSSDHKPVYGFFDVNIRRPISRIPLSLGMFNRKVYMKAFKSSPNTKKKVNDRLPPKYVKPKTNVKVELKENNETSSIINNHENLYKNVIRHINSSYDNKENLWYSEIGKECNNSKNVDKFYFGNYSKNPLKKKIVNTILQPFNLPAILFFDDEKDDFKIKGIDFDDLRRRRINKYLLIIVHTGRLERYELRQTILEKIVSKYSAINGFLIRITYVVGLIQNEDWKDYTKISELYYQSQFFQVNTLSFEEFVINHGKHVTVNSFKVLPLILKVSSYSSYLVLNVTEEYRNMVVKHVSWINWFNRYFSSSTLSNIMKRQQMKNSNTFLKPFYNLNGRIDWKYKFIQPDFILKIDDDVIPNIRLITKSLQERQTVYEQTHHDVTCLTIVSGNALRGGKWKATCEEYPFKTYPHYCIGYGYLAKPVYIKSIAILSYYMREFWIDDVLVTGIMRHRLWYQLNKGQHEKKNSQQLHLVPGTKEFPIFRRCSLVLKDAKNISMAKRKCANSFFHTSEIAIPKSLVNVLYELY